MRYNVSVVGKNVAVGYQSQMGVNALSTGQHNTSVGCQSLEKVNGGQFNTGVGSLALGNVVGGSNNSSFGYGSGSGITSGGHNCSFGIGSQNGVITGSSNCAFGNFSQNVMSAGGNNSSVGYASLQNVAGGSNNSAFGMNAGFSTTSGTNNLLLGYGAGTNTSALTVTTQSDQCVIANNTTTNHYLSLAPTGAINTSSTCTNLTLMGAPTTVNAFGGSTALSLGASTGTTTINNPVVLKPPISGGWTNLLAYAPVFKTITVLSNGCIAQLFTFHITKFGRQVSVTFPYTTFTAAFTDTLKFTDLFIVAGHHILTDCRYFIHTTSSSDVTNGLGTLTHHVSGDVTIRMSVGVPSYTQGSAVVIYGNTTTFISVNESD